MSRVQVRRMSYCLILCLKLIKIFKFPEPMFIDGTNRFSEVSEHLRIFEIKLTIIIMKNPGENRVLR
jgi:hypothetical protein